MSVPLTQRVSGGLRKLALLAAALACTPPVGGPQPTGMTPFQGSGDAPVEVEIAGRGFEARVETDFRDGQGALDSGFKAVLAPSGGGVAVPLERVSFTERRTLLATVPTGVAHGLHDLVVTDP